MTDTSISSRSVSVSSTQMPTRRRAAEDVTGCCSGRRHKQQAQAGARASAATYVAPDKAQFNPTCRQAKPGPQGYHSTTALDASGRHSLSTRNGAAPKVRCLKLMHLTRPPMPAGSCLSTWGIIWAVMSYGGSRFRGSAKEYCEARTAGALAFTASNIWWKRTRSRADATPAVPCCNESRRTQRPHLDHLADTLVHEWPDLLNKSVEPLQTSQTDTAAVSSRAPPAAQNIGAAVDARSTEPDRG